MYKVLSSAMKGLPRLNNEYACFWNNPYSYQTLRWKRKPWWLPTAKSKMFRVPQHKKIPEEEQKELCILWNHYRTAMKSINAYMAEKLQASQTGEEVIAEQARLEHEEHLRCVKLNDEWNQQVKVTREQRIAAEIQIESENILKTLELKQQEEAEKKAKAEELVRLEKERSKHYITSSNIDAAIEEALSKEVDYNFAIDLDYNIYQGRRGAPSPNEPPEKIAQAN